LIVADSTVEKERKVGRGIGGSAAERGGGFAEGEKAQHCQWCTQVRMTATYTTSV